MGSQLHRDAAGLDCVCPPSAGEPRSLSAIAEKGSTADSKRPTTATASIFAGRCEITLPHRPGTTISRPPDQGPIGRPAGPPNESSGSALNPSPPTPISSTLQIQRP